MALWKPFLEITPQGDSVAAAFSFSRGTILVFKELEKPTGARGHRHFHRYDGCNAITSAFAAGKFGVRAFSQSLVKESGKENKHVAYSIIDGGFLVDPKPTKWHIRIPP